MFYSSYGECAKASQSPMKHQGDVQLSFHSTQATLYKQSFQKN